MTVIHPCDLIVSGDRAALCVALYRQGALVGQQLTDGRFVVRCFRPVAEVVAMVTGAGGIVVRRCCGFYYGEVEMKKLLTTIKVYDIDGEIVTEQKAAERKESDAGLPSWRVILSGIGVLIALLVLIMALAACNQVGVQPKKTADGIDGIGVMWVGRKSYRMPCIVFVDWGGDGSRMAWSCDWSMCGPDNECLDGLPDLGEVVVREGE